MSWGESIPDRAHPLAPLPLRCRVLIAIPVVTGLIATSLLIGWSTSRERSDQVGAELSTPLLGDPP